MSLIPFPNVPALPGVPNIPRNPLAAAATVITVISNFAAQARVQLLRAFAQPPVYGIVDAKSFKTALAYDSFIGDEFTNNQNISDYPVEKSSFATYNKVPSPYQIAVTISKGGTDAERQKFKYQVDALAGSTQVLHVVTPDFVYLRCNLVGAAWGRTARNGVSLTLAHLRFEEVRIAPAAQYSEPDGKTKPVTTEQTSSVNAPSPTANGQTKTTSTAGYAAGVYNLTGVQ